MTQNINNQPATKKDMEKLATKDDLKKFVTKDDLKEELKKYATKTDLKKAERNLRGEILRVEGRVENLEDGQKRIEKKIDKMASVLDGFVGTVDDLRVDNEVGVHQAREIQIKVDDHEKRLKTLESSTHQV